MIVTQEVSGLLALDARDQGLRRTCLAFSLCALGHSASPHPEGLSPEYLYLNAARSMPNWFPGLGLSLHAALAASGSVALDRDCPYKPEDPMLPLPPLPAPLDCYGHQAGELSTDVGVLSAELQQGRAVGLGLMLTENFYRPVEGRIKDGGNVVPDSGHAVVAVALGVEGGQTHFLIRNSWGGGWGTEGKAWISSSYIAQHAICAFGV